MANLKLETSRARRDLSIYCRNTAMHACCNSNGFVVALFDMLADRAKSCWYCFPACPLGRLIAVVCYLVYASSTFIHNCACVPTYPNQPGCRYRNVKPFLVDIGLVLTSYMWSVYNSEYKVCFPGLLAAAAGIHKGNILQPVVTRIDRRARVGGIAQLHPPTYSPTPTKQCQYR